MTADPATYSTPFAVEDALSKSRLPDPVYARVSGTPQLVYSQSYQFDSATRSEAAHRGLPLPPDSRGRGPCAPHPGDILYWVACLGGAGLLLLCATT